MSALTINLDALTENRLKQRSLQEGRKQEEVAASLLADSLHAPALSEMTEAQLLKKINEGWKEVDWNRYHALVSTQKSGALTPAEYDELAELTIKREVANAELLRHLFALSHLWNLSLNEVRGKLGIEVPGNVE